MPTVEHMPDDRVVIKAIGVEGFVTEMTIKPRGYVCYTVVYWVEGMRNEEIVEECEIIAADESKEQTSITRKKRR